MRHADRKTTHPLQEVKSSPRPARTRRSLYLLSICILLSAHVVQAGSRYMDTEYLTKLNLQLIGTMGTMEEPKNTTVRFFPGPMQSQDVLLTLKQLNHTGVFHCYEDHGKIVVKKVSLFPEELRQALIAGIGLDPNTAPALIEVEHQDADILLHDSDTGQDTVLRSGITLMNEYLLDDLPAAIIQKIRTGHMELKYRVQRKLQDSTGFYFQAHQKESAWIDKLLKYYVGDLELADILARYTETMEKDVLKYFVVDRECMEDPNCYAYMNDLAEGLSEKVYNYEMAMFVPIEDIKNADASKDWNSCIDDNLDGTFEILDPLKFDRLTTEVIQDSKYYDYQDFQFSHEGHVGIPVGDVFIGGDQYWDARYVDETVAEDYLAWRGRNHEIGYDPKTIELHFIDTSYLSLEVTFSDIFQIIEQPTEFVKNLPITFTGYEANVAPYPLRANDVLTYSFTFVQPWNFFWNETGRHKIPIMNLSDVTDWDWDLSPADVQSFGIHIDEIRNSGFVGDNRIYQQPNKATTYEGEGCNSANECVVMDEYGRIRIDDFQIVAQKNEWWIPAPHSAHEGNVAIHGTVDLAALLCLGPRREGPVCPLGDLNQDCRVDWLDVSLLCEHWLEESPASL